MRPDHCNNYPPRVQPVHQRTADLLRDTQNRLDGLPDIALYGACGVVALAARCAAIPAADIAIQRGARHNPEWQPTPLSQATVSLLAGSLAVFGDTTRRAGIGLGVLARRLHPVRTAPAAPAATIYWRNADTYPVVYWLCHSLDEQWTPDPPPPPTAPRLIGHISTIIDWCSEMLHAATPAVETSYELVQEAGRLAVRCQ